MGRRAGARTQRAPEVLDVALTGIDGLLYIVERVAVFAAAGLDAGERGEGGEYLASAAMARSGSPPLPPGRPPCSRG